MPEYLMRLYEIRYVLKAVEELMGLQHNCHNEYFVYDGLES